MSQSSPYGENGDDGELPWLLPCNERVPRANSIIWALRFTSQSESSSMMRALLILFSTMLCQLAKAVFLYTSIFNYRTVVRHSCGHANFPARWAFLGVFLLSIPIPVRRYTPVTFKRCIHTAGYALRFMSRLRTASIQPTSRPVYDAPRVIASRLSDLSEKPMANIFSN